MYLNKAILIGNLTRDPENKALPSGIQVSSFGLATNRVWKDKNAAKQESTDFHNIVVFGRQAEIVSQYIKKGDNVLIEGRIQTRSWDGPDGAKKYRTEIVAERVQFGPKRQGGGGTYSKEDQSPKAPEQEEGGSIEYPEESINVEDIPF